MAQTPTTSGFAPYRDPTSGRVMLAQVTKQGRHWVDARGLRATSTTVRATREEAWKLAARKYPDAPPPSALVRAAMEVVEPKQARKPYLDGAGQLQDPADWEE